MNMIPVDKNELFNFMCSQDSPLMEMVLIKKFIPSGKSGEKEYSLYEKHFSIYNALYNLKFEAGKLNYYLHLDPMRICMVCIPETGFCHHYLDTPGKFCTVKCDGDFCEIHKHLYKGYENSLHIDYLMDFYLDPENIAFGDSELLKKLMNGMKLFCRKKSEIDRALYFFNLQFPDKKRITKRYRELASRYHPDKPGGSEEKMRILNQSYQVLREVYIL